jgi:hypothetical protein
LHKSFTIVKNVGVFIVNRSLILFENFVMLTEKLIKNKLQLERATQLGYAQPLRSPVGEEVARPLVALLTKLLL